MKKRFIAGASCPECQNVDSLRWWIENNIEWVECVECQHKAQRSPKSLEQSPQSEQQMIAIFKPD
ncbi:YheV family putative zinc ribbon protein [Vibrio sp. WXL103]|uniref:YheV family putative zinc ribbon protein n=1 Tax=unclassified Vibrio TaxID=2614977 RepID=UPI003EC705EC